MTPVPHFLIRHFGLPEDNHLLTFPLLSFIKVRGTNTDAMKMLSSTVQPQCWWPSWRVRAAPFSLLYSGSRLGLCVVFRVHAF
jgi:hypothetical protein